MSYKLSKPYSQKQKLDFLVNYNHKLGLKIIKTDSAIFALEPWESLDGESVIENKLSWEQSEFEKVKLAKIKENEVKRELFLNSGIEYNGVIFDSDISSRVNIINAISVMQDNDTIVWYSSKNEPVTFVKQDLMKLNALLLALNSSVWGENGLNLKYINAIENAKTVIDLDNIEIAYFLEREDANE